jgi:hypothetical protein
MVGIANASYTCGGTQEGPGPINNVSRMACNWLMSSFLLFYILNIPSTAAGSFSLSFQWRFVHCQGAFHMRWVNAAMLIPPFV